MGSLIKFEVVELPKIYVMGKELRCNIDTMKENNPIPDFWHECMKNGTFKILGEQGEDLYSDDYVGVMLDFYNDDGGFSYICGMLYSEQVKVPDGYVIFELESTKVGVGWIQGKEIKDICYNAHELTEKAIKDSGYNCSGMKWSMELYNCPRFTDPDEHGEMVMDYYIPCTE